MLLTLLLTFHDSLLSSGYELDFRPDIGSPNIQAKLPENHANILLTGQNAL
jgi:hypothetical protein